MSDRTNADAGRSPWDTLAARGQRRGADAVLTSAIAALDAAADGVPVAELSTLRPGRARRSRARRSFGAVGIAALLGIGGYALAGVQGNNGGADSPAAVVHQLADAIDHEDTLAAVATLNPAEIDTLRKTVGDAEHKAAQTKLVDSSSSPLAGIDLGVHDLTTSVTKLTDGVAEVQLTGSISGHVSGARLSEVLRRVAGNADGSLDLSRLRGNNSRPFVVTVERDGTWYVSPAYTAFEYLRTSEGLPPAAFGSADPAKLGAESPTAAVEQLLHAIGAGNWDEVASLAPPDQFPLYEYRAAFAQLMGGPGERFSIDQMNTAQHVDGTNATVDVTASGTYASTDYKGRATTEPWQLRNGCVIMTVPFESPHADASFPSELCLSEKGSFPVGGIGLGIAEAPAATQPVEVHAVEESGRWYVSPVGTALGYLDRWVTNFDQNSLAALISQPLVAPVIGPLPLDRAIDVNRNGPPADLFEFHHYTLHVDGPTDVVIDARATSSSDTKRYPYVASDLLEDVRIYDHNGRLLAPSTTAESHYSLPSAGTYDVVGTTTIISYRLTVWRADHAPTDVPTGTAGCRPLDNGSECSSSGFAEGSDASSSSSSVSSQRATATTIAVSP